MDVELIFRKAFHIEESVDIIELIQASIRVAAFKHPQELAKRRQRIIDNILNSPGEIARERKRRADSRAPNHVDERKKLIIKINVQSRSLKSEMTQVHQAGTVLEKKPEKAKKEVNESRANELKLEATKRTLKERYAQIEREKNKRKIQVLEFKDLPKASGRPPKFSCQTTTRRRGCPVG